MNDHLNTRRQFLQRSLALLAAAGTVPTFLNNTMIALAGPDVDLSRQSSGRDGKILVVVQLSGGNDGLNTVVPYADDAYHRARAGLALTPREVLKINDYLGLHPNLEGLKNLYDDGMMSVIQGVGYPNPNRSHFRSMDIWHTAQPDKEMATSGWLGRYFDNTCEGADPHAGISIGDSLPLSMKGERITPLAFEKPESYRYNGSATDHYKQLNSPITPAEPGIAQAANPELEFLTRTAMDAQVSSDRITRMVRSHVPGVNYPNNELANGLRTIAAMIGGGLETRVYYASLGGFDTHAQQRGRHDNLMRQFADAVSAFWADLRHQGNDDRVLMMTFSEFGRRVAANASGGTDHGAAAPMFLFGKHIEPGILGKHPSLTDLDQGDLKYRVDFRHIYAAILEKWLETPSRDILGGQFKPVPVIKA